MSAPQPILRELPGARVAFSTRAGGVSAAPYDSLNLGILTDDERSSILANRDRLATAVGLDPGAIAMGWQVHGTDIQRWSGPPPRSAFQDPDGDLVKADGHITREPGLGLLVLAADCLPVALAGGGQVAMLHCGWRPLAGGIIKEALGHFDEPPEAVIGPGIGPCCFEVGPEVLEAFSHVPEAASGRMLDLAAVARHELESRGVAVEDVGLCTSCRGDLFFSHRRDKGLTGRQGGLVWLTA